MSRVRILARIAGLLAAAAILAPSASEAGRGDKVGSASGMQLLIPVGARSIALGGSALSSVAGVEAIAWNPAGLARTERPAEVSFSHMTYLADIGVNYFAAGKDLGGRASLGFSIKALTLGEIPVTTETEPDGTGETVSPTFLVAGLTFSRMMSDQIAVGIAANVLHERMAEVSVTGIAFTGGVQYTRLGGIDGLSVGVVLRNVGPKLAYDGEGLERTGVIPDADRPETNYKVEAASADLPSTIEVGLGYLHPLGGPADVSITTLFRNNNFSDDEYKAGVELSYDRRFFLRGGFDYSTEADGNESIYGPAFGAGVKDRVQTVEIAVDYAYRAVEFFGGNHVLTLILGF